MKILFEKHDKLSNIVRTILNLFFFFFLNGLKKIKSLAFVRLFIPHLHSVIFDNDL